MQGQNNEAAKLDCPLTPALFIKIVLGALFFQSGCSSVPIVDLGRRGIFQNPDGSSTVAASSGMENVDSASANPENLEHGFRWPVHGLIQVSSPFGKRRRKFHEGIDIRAHRGTPIYASNSGKVIYSSRKIKGYGNMVVIMHPNNFATVYAHNSKNAVKQGENVDQGQLIGYVGSTGRSTGPHLHFEIRRNELAENPLNYLPQKESIADSKNEATTHSTAL